MLKTIVFIALVGLISAEKWRVPNPISRVSGKSFLPSKMRNTELLRVESDIFPLAMGGPKSMIHRKNVNLDLCPGCIQLADQALDLLLNYVLNVGVVGSCGEICAYVADKTSSKPLGIICNLLCDYVGIDEFIKIIDKADLDPIYYCELLKACPIFDQGDANITNFRVTPSRGPQGTFGIVADWVTRNGTGTGEIYLGIRTVDDIPVETSFLQVPQKPGKYQTAVSLNAVPDPDCDPSQGPCEAWLPGLYKVEIAICNGQCGSSHPHSKIYTQAVTNFTITN